MLGIDVDDADPGGAAGDADVGVRMAIPPLQDLALVARCFLEAVPSDRLLRARAAGEDVVAARRERERGRLKRGSRLRLGPSRRGLVGKVHGEASLFWVGRFERLR